MADLNYGAALLCYRACGHFEPRVGRVSNPPNEHSPEQKAHWEGLTVFHEAWWLDAVAPGRWFLLTAQENGRVAGFLPVWNYRRWGIPWRALPPFTHVLGPAIDVGEGSATTKTHRRHQIASQLLEQVPQRHFFRQVVDVSAGDLLGFQAHGFSVSPHYTILIDCAGLEDVWAGFRQNTRRFIRKAQSQFSVEKSDDAAAFVAFYVRNLRGQKVSYWTDMARFPELYKACRHQDAGQIYVAKSEGGAWVAAVFVAWDHAKMYYILTTRDKSVPDYGVVSLIIWRLIQEAHRRALVLDLDGIISEPILKFLTGFGGVIVPRMVVQRLPKLLQTARSVQALLRHGHPPTFI